jgi:hypothetical protein
VDIPKALNPISEILFRETKNGPVDQLGMIAAFATRKPRVQIPPGPPNFNSIEPILVQLFESVSRLISSAIYLVRTRSWRLEMVIKTLLCGCVYDENEWMLVRVKECEKHHRQRTRKREYRPKAECNRNDTRGE